VRFARALEAIDALLRPLALVVTGVSTAILRVFGVRTSPSRGAMSRQDFQLLLDESEETGQVAPTQGRILSRVLDFGETTVAQVMQPRTDVVAVDLTATVREVILLVQKTGWASVDEELFKLLGAHAASALIAAGFLATMTGADIDPAATLAGVVNGDGTIGPVAGIPEQFLGGIAHGKTRLGYPSGMRFARSEATGKPVDLVQLARSHHAEAVELATVYDAYRLLTRKPLPAPVPVAAADMALDPDTVRGLETTYLAWQKRLAGEWAELLLLDQAGRLPATLRLMVRLAQDGGARAEALYRAGKLPAALARMLAAWVYAAGANDTYAVLGKLAAGDVSGAVAALAALAPPDAATAAMFNRIGALRPSSLAGHLMMVAAFEAALRGWAYQAFAGDAIRATTQFLTGFQGKSQTELGATATADTVADSVAPTVVMMLRTVAELAVAEQELGLERDQGIAYTGSPPDVSRLAAALQAVATAGLGYVDALVVDPLARSAGLAQDAARRRVASAEPDYLIAGPLARVPADGLPHELAAAWGDGSLAGSLLSLAGHDVAYRSAAILVARYDSLAIHAAGTGKLDAVEPAEAFRHLLANAERFPHSLGEAISEFASLASLVGVVAREKEHSLASGFMWIGSKQRRDDFTQSPHPAERSASMRRRHGFVLQDPT
jgi:hypothetical protein